ncbi:hypothetical protein NX786_01070 [Telluria mixta]|uniref:VWA domain-containing protein n=1 Tax=Telluria mixta TaxID=34071 RepID=A0ABT2BTZ4_9BURK|nr:hypothetical protein [Telluria mixta]MCS0627934.1 hypothetical protein [Telluria mixta]WEM93947.1 hypothetical protein P0M04_20920 [Telluria mixta]
MLIGFFFALKKAKIRVSVSEFLSLLEAIQKKVIGPSVNDFYYLSRTTLVKDETHYDKFDKAFGLYFQGVCEIFDENLEGTFDLLSPGFGSEALPVQQVVAENFSSDKLIKCPATSDSEREVDPHGDNNGRGKQGNSPFINGGKNPQGNRADGKGGNRSATKVWEARPYRDYDNERELGIRNMKMALRRLRKFSREGFQEEFALAETVHATANNAGYLDIKMQRERKNNIKVLMLLDVGGTMDDHIRCTEELFSAVKGEFKNMEFFYFHNCVYGYLWKSNCRRQTERFITWDVLRKYRSDTRLIFVGDASMNPYEVLQPGGSVEYNNEEAGAVWLERCTTTFPRFIWLNPESEDLWSHRKSTDLIRQIMNNRMFPLTIAGIERGMRLLSK